MRPQLIDLLNAHGLEDDSPIEEHIKPGLQANKIFRTQHQGLIFDPRPAPYREAWYGPKHREHHGQAQHPGVEDKMYLPKIEFVSLLQGAGGRLRLTDSSQVT